MPAMRLHNGTADSQPHAATLRLADKGPWETTFRRAGLAIVQVLHLSTIRTSIAKRAKVPRDNP
jgi:hypothetical protein